MTSSREHLGSPYLSASQLAALRYINERLESRRLAAYETLHEILKRANLSEDSLIEAMQNLQRYDQVVLDFHPDRLTTKGQSVA